MCGNRRPEDVVAASGADAVGVIVASPQSPRNLSLEAAEHVLGAARPGQLRVAVTSAVDGPTLSALARLGDAVQCPAAAFRLLPALRRRNPGTRFLLATRPDGWHDAAKDADLVLLDALTDDGYGGGGKRVDPAAAAAVVAACPRPVLLAGGLRPENVGEAIRAVRPFGVDASSGLEIDGQKDPERVRAFIREARRALEEVEG